MTKIVPVETEEEKRQLQKELENLPIPNFDTLFEERQESILPLVLGVVTIFLLLVNIVISMIFK